MGKGMTITDRRLALGIPRYTRDCPGPLTASEDHSAGPWAEEKLRVYIYIYMAYAIYMYICIYLYTYRYTYIHMYI